jgi:hypothetical protein
MAIHSNAFSFSTADLRLQCMKYTKQQTKSIWKLYIQSCILYAPFSHKVGGLSI